MEINKNEYLKDYNQNLYIYQEERKVLIFANYVINLTMCSLRNSLIKERNFFPQFSSTIKEFRA